MFHSRHYPKSSISTAISICRLINFFEQKINFTEKRHGMTLFQIKKRQVVKQSFSAADIKIKDAKSLLIPATIKRNFLLQSRVFTDKMTHAANDFLVGAIMSRAALFSPLLRFKTGQRIFRSVGCILRCQSAVKSACCTRVLPSTLCPIINITKRMRRIFIQASFFQLVFLSSRVPHFKFVLA
jgi:hypothetical protein